MASTSGAGSGVAAGRIRSHTSAIYSDNQSLIREIRKAVTMMKDIAVDLERDERTEMVKDLEAGVIQLLGASDECMHLSEAIQSIGDELEPGPEPTNFKKKFDEEIAKSKARSLSSTQSQPLLRQFREAIWHVHHAGQPMPGEEQEDIVMTSTQCNLLNVTCPLSGKPVTELVDPVRSMDCKHIYEKKAILQFIKSKTSRGQCPVAGCPKVLQAQRVLCDPFLLIEIDEVRSMSKQNAGPDAIEDFTTLDEED
ncbi:E3 SUMO-protein ligase MMS21-like [Nicotiana tabacum]|uniref:E3 SUMO-protein ligase MMS21-like n=1 Tax=Nicotiana tabacum TaxID=4097 RepID=A0AC58T463_TOBAC|nr:E3 SUMO-protein ligase MMS21 isoform X2 [Nicotiana tomentosiformis]